MKTWQVWMAGYRISGNSAPHRLVGEFEAETFRDACAEAFKNEEPRSVMGGPPRSDFNPERLTHWGCSLHDNEEDARRATP